METEPSKATVYYDGSCALCRAEISHYRRLDGDDALRCVDVSAPGAAVPEGVTPSGAMARFHVRASDGRILAGAAAFVEVWRNLPGWRWAARVAAVPGVLSVLELGYRLFLPVRPILSGIVARITRDGARQRPGGR